MLIKRRMSGWRDTSLEAYFWSCLEQTWIWMGASRVAELSLNPSL